ncbi:MAG TPA: 2,3-bisphosphoglycerate-independent phosphoglycerate mutase [Candidatus Omnitrophota bacterium]|nr:2,3-bisphosphoglycerate-independent phosphoglycerate mutase [Candidatus Omnitrophota bacterium]HPD85060.1 2,3-bisphosphoglycerate-independent phosphoglycerate mutase [Candidatus Omnitrophota bacterium]HRZ03918.1 2,3-bisphosphoglycerate-independent phosphoglycerate mutase [Candidatus Omnitrophota bacterium]
MPFQLKKLKEFSGRKGPLLFIIMDGVGIGKRDASDGVFMAQPPCLNGLMKSSLYTVIQAHGKAVGMPSDEDMGNSEVGHNALGAGRVFMQGAKLVNNAIETGKIFQTPLWADLTSRVKKNNRTFHLIGLLSDGNVHSHIDHLFAIIKQCAKEGVRKVRVHALLDGRDVPEKSSPIYLKKTEEFLSSVNKEFGVDCRIASGGGRMVTTMDRYNADWTVVKRGWDAHVLGKARSFSSALQAVEAYYKEDPQITDQYLNSFVVTENDKPVGTIQDGDSVVFFNFRGDRAIEITRAFEEKDFTEFDRERTPNVLYAGMMQYDGDLLLPKNYLVSPPQIDHTVSEYVCGNNIASFAISETQKFGHVTYFWNGNKSGYVDKKLEKYFEIPSDRIRFDQAPKMKALEIADKTTELLKSGKYKFGRLNFANGDMVGHTGVESAIITAVKTVDICVERLIKVVTELNGIIVISADHGNADEMFTVKDGKKIVKTAHTLNPVPFAIVDSGYSQEYVMASLEKRGLSNVAATLLNLLGFEKPDEYDPSLITFKS